MEESKVRCCELPIRPEADRRNCPRSGSLSHSHQTVPNSLKGRVKPGWREWLTQRRLKNVTSSAPSRGWIRTEVGVAP